MKRLSDDLYADTHRCVIKKLIWFCCSSIVESSWLSLSASRFFVQNVATLKDKTKRFYHHREILPSDWQVEIDNLNFREI